MDRGICVMVMVSAIKKGDKIPTRLAIAIAPTKKIAKKLATDELRLFTSTEYDLTSQQIGQIVYTPVPTTIFLYTQSAGRIK